MESLIAPQIDSALREPLSASARESLRERCARCDREIAALFKSLRDVGIKLAESGYGDGQWTRALALLSREKDSLLVRDLLLPVAERVAAMRRKSYVGQYRRTRDGHDGAGFAGSSGALILTGGLVCM